MELVLVNFHNADQFMQMSSINLVISEEDNNLKSVLSLMLHNSFAVAASVLSEISFPVSFVQ